MPHRTRVLIVDDSPTVRSIFAEILATDPDINVVGTAEDPFDAREKIKQLNPHVITLDIEMPKMDGISFLEKIMALRPMPVVMVSSLTQRGAEITMTALEMGAVDYIGKPSSDLGNTLPALREELISKVKNAAKANVAGRVCRVDSNKRHPYMGDNNRHLIAIGSSTGGVEAVRDVLTAMPHNAPPIVIVQHMPAAFTGSFARRLNSLCEITVVEAEHHQRLAPGYAYIAPGSHHLEIHRSGTGWVTKLLETPLVSGHRPSADVLFASVAKAAGAEAVGAILTGMGRDGAAGLLQMRQAGATTLGQNAESCVVYGMPRAAMELGAVCAEHPIRQMGEKILAACTATAPPLHATGRRS